MLDDLYKNAVVSITKTYVSKQDDRPAIMIAKDVFGAMQKKGWHSARLVDATGEPLNDANAPRTEFEKEASRRIRVGQAVLRPRGRRGQGSPAPGRHRRPRRHGEVRRVPREQEGGRRPGLPPLRGPRQVRITPAVTAWPDGWPLDHEMSGRPDGQPAGSLNTKDTKCTKGEGPSVGPVLNPFSCISCLSCSIHPSVPETAVGPTILFAFNPGPTDPPRRPGPASRGRWPR